MLFQQRFFQKLCCTASTAVCGSRSRFELYNAGVEIHPPVIGEAEALVYPRSLERLYGSLVAGVADEERGYIRAHMPRFGFNMAHALLVGIVSAFFKDVLGKMRNGEDVDILIAVIFPELCRFYENIFLRVDIQKAGGGKLACIVVEPLNVEVCRVALAQLVYSL